jgi:excisionase family DNA binding protein
MQSIPSCGSGKKVGWRVSEWANAVGLCRATVYNLLAEGRLRSVKLGAARIILTPPSDFLESFEGDDTRIDRAK